MHTKIRSLVELRLSFFIAVIIFIALGYIEQFFIIFFAAVLHELSHVMAAAICKLNTEKIIFTPLGLTAVIRNLDRKPLSKKLLVLSAGPLVSLALSASFFPIQWRYANMAVFLLNILPVYPLDGGMILRRILGATVGILPGDRMLIMISGIGSVLIIIAGMVQIILYSFNFSLLCIGFYLFRQYKRARLQMIHEFYISLTEIPQSGDVCCKKTLCLTVAADCDVNEVLQFFRAGHFHTVHVLNGSKVAYSITELDIANHIIENGLHGTVGEIET